MNHFHIDLINPKQKRASALIAMALILLALASYSYLHPAGSPAPVALEKRAATQLQLPGSNRASAEAAEVASPPPAIEVTPGVPKGEVHIGQRPWTSPPLQRGSMAAWVTGDATGDHIYLRDGSGERLLVSAQEPLKLAEWWPDGRGLLLWHLWGYCNSCNADGWRLATVGVDGQLTDLANVDLQAGGYSWSPSGRQLLIGTGGDRFVIFGDPKVLTCDIDATSCFALPRPPGSLDLTPSWSPRGDFVTFARGSMPEPGSGINATVAAWQETLGIWIARANGTGQKLLSTPGGSYPTWSPDGRSVYFVHASRRWRHDLYTGENVDTGEAVTGNPGRGWVDYHDAGDDNRPAYGYAAG